MEMIETKAAEPPMEEAHCLNCGAAVMGAYCQACGQRHLSHVYPFRRLLTEVFSTIFHLDNRLLQTLKLLFRPGRLTKAYLAGQRVRFVSPFRLYLILSVFYFAVASLVGTTEFLFVRSTGETQIEGLGQALPRLMFVVVPGFALLLKALYRQRLYAEHLVFALHVHAVWYILFAITGVLRPWTNQAIEAGHWTVLTVLAFIGSTLAQVYILIFLFMGMRYVYGSSRGKTWVKIVLLFFGYFVMMLSVVILYLQFQAGLTP